MEHFDDISELEWFDQGGDPKQNDGNRTFHKVARFADKKESVWYWFLKEDNGNSGQCITCGDIISAAGTSGMRNHQKKVHSNDLDQYKKTPGPGLLTTK